MRLNIVVLPAPFGPISAVMPFRSTVKLTFDSATSPPKRRETPAQLMTTGLTAAVTTHPQLRILGGI